MQSEWHQHVEAVQAGVRPLHFLEGTWSGEGFSNGESVRGQLTARLVLGATFLECTEKLYNAAGELDHEDRVLYRYDSENQTLRALHLQHPGWVAERHVDRLDDHSGIVWRGGPTLTRVQVQQLDQDTVHIAVWMPGDAEAVTQLTYKRDT